MFNPLKLCACPCLFVFTFFSVKKINYCTQDNIEQRIINHNSGGAISTRNRTPLKLIFCEFYLFEEDARKREKYFKITMGKKAIKLMLANSLLKMGYKSLGVQISDDET